MTKTSMMLIPAVIFMFAFSVGNTYAEDLASLYPPSTVVIKHHNSWTREHYPRRIANFKKMPLKMGDIVFLGDSITEQGRNWGKKFNIPIVKNRGIPGDITDGVIERLGEIFYYKPRAVFLLIGVNDLNLTPLSNEYIGNNIVKIAKMIHEKTPQTRIYVQTILPTKNKRLIPKIKEVNSILKKHEKDGTYTLIDLHPLFADENDLIKKELTSDGIHLSQAGYKVWVGKVKSLVEKANGK